MLALNISQGRAGRGHASTWWWWYTLVLCRDLLKGGSNEQTIHIDPEGFHKLARYRQEVRHGCHRQMHAAMQHQHVTNFSMVQQQSTLSPVETSII